METAIVFKIGVLAILSFAIAIVSTPLLTHFLYKYKLGKQIRDASTAPIFASLHKDKEGTPTMGGILIWVTVLVLALVFYVLHLLFPDSIIGQLNFLSREETLLPLGIFVLAAIIGLVDDYLGVRRIGPKGGGFGVLYRLGLYTVIAAVGAL